MKLTGLIGVVIGLIAALLAIVLSGGPGTSTAAAPTAASAQSATVVNTAPAATGQYWTQAKMDAAKPYTPTRTAAAGASFGSSGLDFTRSRITPQSANTQPPYKTAGKLFFTIPNQGNFVCSASTIAKRLVLTAAHCMYSAGIGFHTNWLFVPGYDGTKAAPKDRPFGTWNWVRGQVPVQWINTNGSLPNNDDFGILVMQDQSFSGGPPLQLYRKSGLFSTTVGHLFDTHVSMLGYPCNFDSCLIQQRVDSSDHRSPPGSSGSTAYEYGSDMTGGSSGGPWVENLGNPAGAAPTGSWTTRNTVVGVTSYIYTDPAVLVEGASQLNGNFTTIRSQSCAAAAGNC